MQLRLAMNLSPSLVPVAIIIMDFVVYLAQSI